MSFRPFMLLLALICTKTSFAAQDSTAVLSRIQVEQAVGNLFVGSVYLNPAVNYYRNSTSLTELLFTGDYKQSDRALITQEGSGCKGYAFHASSFMKVDSDTRVWGSAYYKNGTRKSVKWNESSDFSIVYPYVMADSIGGDLSSEEYYFAGGYAHRKGNFTWGLEGNFRALLEYRNVDPRPKNICSDLNITAGSSFLLNRYYSLGVNLAGRKYKQTNEVEFLSELGSARVYHFTGLGMDYTRFSGGMTDTYYNGHSYGAGIQLFPAGKKGFYSSLSFTTFSLEKVISSLNELPLANIAEQKVMSEIAFKSSSGKKEWGVKGNFMYKDRSGTENLFGDPVSNVYTRIGKVKQYNDRQINGAFSAYYSGISLSSCRLSIMPEVGYVSQNTTYKYPSRAVDYSALNSRFYAELAKAMSKSLFRLGAGLTYSKNIDSSIKLNEMAEGGVKQMLLNDYEFLSADYTSLVITPRWDYCLPQNRALFVKAGYAHGWYKSGVASDNVSITLGLSF